MPISVFTKNYHLKITNYNLQIYKKLCFYKNNFFKIIYTILTKPSLEVMILIYLKK